MGGEVGRVLCFQRRQAGECFQQPEALLAGSGERERKRTKQDFDAGIDSPQAAGFGVSYVASTSLELRGVFQCFWAGHWRGPFEGCEDRKGYGSKRGEAVKMKTGLNEARRIEMKSERKGAEGAIPQTSFAPQPAGRLRPCGGLLATASQRPRIPFSPTGANWTYLLPDPYRAGGRQVEQTQQGSTRTNGGGVKGSRNGGAVAPAPPSQAAQSGGAGGGAGAGLSAVSDAAGHHQIRDIKRSSGQSAVKSAAYITGTSMFDARVGLTFGRLEAAGRVLASGTVGPAGSQWTPEQLWGEAEKAEMRKNSRVAQEHVLALPHQLDEAAHKRLLNGYALHLRDRYGVASTWALHAPNDRGDHRNTHGHLLTTTRRAEVGPDGEPRMGEKVRALSGNKATVSAEIEHQRQEWTRRVNAELERAGLTMRLDHRSHARRAEAGEAAPGLEPGAHRGAKETAKQRRDPTRRQRATAAEQGRTQRNQAQTAAWKALGGNSAATAALRSLEQTQRVNEREATAAARWAKKQAREWEQWRRQQEAAAAKEAGGRDDDEPR